MKANWAESFEITVVLTLRRFYMELLKGIGIVMDETGKAYSRAGMHPFVSVCELFSSVFFVLEIDCFLTCLGGSFN